MFIKTASCAAEKRGCRGARMHCTHKVLTARSALLPVANEQCLSMLKSIGDLLVTVVLNHTTSDLFLVAECRIGKVEIVILT